MSNTAEVLEAPVLRVVKEEVDVNAWIYHLTKHDSEGIKDLDTIICNVFMVDPDVLFTPNRHKEVKNARFAYMYIMHVVYQYGWSALKRITGWDHTSVMHSVKKANDFIETEPAYDMRIRKVLAEVMSSMVRVPVDPKVNPGGYNVVFKGEQVISSTLLCSREKNS